VNGLIGQQRRRYNGKRGVLVTGGANRSGERTPAFDSELHGGQAS